MASRVFTKFTPLADRVLLKKLKLPDKIGGVFLPESVAKPSFREAEVVAVGKGRRGPDGSYLTPAVKVGDLVAVSEYGGTNLKFDNEEYSLFSESDILGIIEKKS